MTAEASEVEDEAPDVSRLSETARELSRVSVKMARDTLRKASQGYRSRGGEQIPPTSSNLKWLYAVVKGEDSP